MVSDALNKYIFSAGLWTRRENIERQVYKMSVKIIEREQGIIAYIPENMRFFEINERTKNIIQAWNFGISDDKIVEKFGIPAGDLNELKNRLGDLTEKNGEKSRTKKAGLNKLVLNISNACNLRCRYCYANGGSYQSDEGIMTVDTAKRAMDLFYDVYETIQMIQIFGGEPLMNLPLVRYICEYITTNKKNTKIGIVTNGTLITDEFIQLVKKFNIMVTVSYDGVPVVNDLMRVTKNGKGTSEKILSNIKLLYEKTGQPSTIEVTFNQQHVNHGVSVGDVIKFLRREVGAVPLHIVPAGGDKKCDFVLENRDEFVKSVDDVFHNTENMDMYTYSLVQRIVLSLYTKRGGTHLCEAGLSTYSVSINGDVYPCFMFTDDENMCIGNIFDDEMFERDKFKNMVHKLEQFSKSNIPECQSCFIRQSCSGCLGINLLETGDVFSLGSETCEMYRQMTEQVIYNLYLMKKEGVQCEIAG